VSWKPEDVESSLVAMFEWVEGEAVRSVAWYLREKRYKARWSRRLRVLAVIFATAGTVAPLVAATTGWFGSEWGYVLLALAAGSVALDRYFGFSSAWMRYLLAAQTIQRRLHRLRFEWLSSCASAAVDSPSCADVTTRLTMLAEAGVDFGDQVRRETAAWVTEFQTNLSELRAMADSRAAELRRRDSSE
jgi:hypothetical protein